MRRSRGFFLLESLITALVIGALVLLLLMSYGQSYLYLTRVEKLNRAYNLASCVLAGKSGDNQDFSVGMQTGDFQEVQVRENGQVVLNFFTTP